MKNNNQILEELNGIFHKVFDNKNLVIKADTTAADIKEWDSLNHMHLIAEIEHHFNCAFDFEEVVNFRNVGDIITNIQSKYAK